MQLNFGDPTRWLDRPSHVGVGLPLAGEPDANASRRMRRQRQWAHATGVGDVDPSDVVELKWRIEVGESKWANQSGQGRARTADTGLFRAVLYQLSYLTFIDSKASPARNLKSSRTTPLDQFDAEGS